MIELHVQGKEMAGNQSIECQGYKYTQEVNVCAQCELDCSFLLQGLRRLPDGVLFDSHGGGAA